MSPISHGRGRGLANRSSNIFSKEEILFQANYGSVIFHVTRRKGDLSPCHQMTHGERVSEIDQKKCHVIFGLPLILSFLVSFVSHLL